ncbi:MAG: pyrroline-5-carboxylate reductase [Bacteroidetes bacterium GWE2_29_8]|nr:MAG: pyrroline-5-carboxylate reductase [Bacteroidetes bacterium GWE2_29_8]OFY23055.1 MAG: pyrroline-5-carboxylate reductase [Bacteroidetes bacterium GWF2_29_10]HBY21635.1 pyrroline-5-carboxylate reductase [Clostridiales bacterium]
MKFFNNNIAIIGAGNLGKSIAQGFVNSNAVKGNQLIVTRRKLNLLEELSSFNINITNDNKQAVKFADIIIISVQPKQLRGVLSEIKEVLTDYKIIISTVTGVSIENIQSVIGNSKKVFRAMPNTAISIMQSMTCVCTNVKNEIDTQKVLDLFGVLGRSLLIEEQRMASATVLAASGIAFSLRYIRAVTQAGIEVGFDARDAQLIASQTVLGSAMLLLESGEHPEKEIDKVTTPLGCTIAGLNEMEHMGFSSSLIKGITTSYKKIASISKDFSDKE